MSEFALFLTLRRLQESLAKFKINIVDHDNEIFWYVFAIQRLQHLSLQRNKHEVK